MTQLRQWYLEYNHTYFNGRLPKDCEVVWRNLDHIKALGRYYDYDPDTQRTKPVIEINPCLRKMKRIAKFTLVHEMAHLSVDTTHPGRKAHGHYWQREMKRLAAKGAFANLW